MSSWYSSWFSGLPTFDFAVPSSIQRRFFSFLLRRTLGRFLKPGQLDLHQIDSQLGSGTVHVRDLELDAQAINQLLVGFPVSLYDGFISGVTARIPFPNPLSSSVGFHVRSLNFTFQLTPEHSTSPPPQSNHDSPSLADSVVSVAETFIHDELTPREEATLRQTLRPSSGSSLPVDESENLPGGFNPFGYHTEEAQKRPHGDDDPIGVSVFASLIERLLAKFEFSAVDTKLTIICPERASFTLSIAEIAYHTDPILPSERDSGLQPVSEGDIRSGQTRTVSITGLKVTSRDLRILAFSPTITTTLSPISPSSPRRPSPPLHNLPDDRLSRNSSSSSLDEDTYLMMSQSIAMLPLGSPPSSSALGSMYQSAVSVANALSAHVDITSASDVDDKPDDVRQTYSRPCISVPSRAVAEDVLLSFGSQPMVFSLQTLRCSRSSEQIQKAGGDLNPENFVQDQLEQETFKLSIVVGTLACAFSSSHLRVLLDIVDACISKLPASPLVSHKKASPSHPRAALCLEANLVIRGIVVIALPELTRGEVISLNAFYERPLVPPRLSRTYLRLFLDALSVFCRLSPLSPDQPMSSSPRTSSSLQVDRSTSTSANVVVSDVSLFVFHRVSSVDDSQVATPILISDHYLPMLHSPGHYRPSFVSGKPEDIELPEFEVVDWTQAKFKSGSAKLSTWRSRSRGLSGKADKSHTPSQKRSDLHSSPSPFISSPLSEVEDKLYVSPAIEVSGRLVPSLSKENSHTVDARLAPLHLFFDLGMIFKDNLVMNFIEDIASATLFAPRRVTDVGGHVFRTQRLGELSEDNADEEKDIRPQQLSFRAREREAERNRLEALVLEDLNLGVNCQHTGDQLSKSSRPHLTLCKQKKTALSEPTLGLRLTCPMIRIEVRCAPSLPQLPRSGGMLLDIRCLTLSNHPPFIKPSLGFSDEVKSGDRSPNVIFGVCLQEILAAYSPVGDSVAHVILTLGTLPTKEVGPNTSTLLVAEADSLPLSVVLGRPTITKKLTSIPSSKLSLAVNIPLVNVVVDKAIFDGLQVWADDVTRLVERSFAAPESATETVSSRNPSLIGSRYFTHTRLSRTHSADESMEVHNRQNTGQTVIKVSITEVLCRFIVPRDDGSRQARPFDICALDVSALIELKPEGKEETLVSIEVVDLQIADTSVEGDLVHLVQNTTRNLVLTPKPLVKLGMTSLVIPGANAKESRIKLSLCGFTVHPSLDSNVWDDLAVFAKAPPGVFESVVPSECTRLVIGFTDVSVRVRALGHPGAAVLHLDEAEFSTEIVGNSSETPFKLSVSSSHILLVDSIQDALELTGTTQTPLGCGVDIWKSSGYALVAKVSHSLFALRTDSAIQPPTNSVVVEHLGLQIHLCADTISALTGLIANIMRTSKDGAHISHSRVTLRTPDAISDRGHNMTASLDEHAFKLVPEVGSAADMICDDLPANPDYLDVSFGTAAGLRELRDDDLEDFVVEEQTNHKIPVMGQLGVVSNVGGETVRILKPLSFIEHYFDTISPDVVRDSNSDTTLDLRIHDSDIALFLHDGFDWPRTRKIIEKEVKEMRKKLARIRQLVATGQTQEPMEEATSTTLFNSFHIGLERDLESMDPDALIAAIDDELDDSADTGTDSSWQSLYPASPGRPRIVSTRVHGKRLTRSKGPSIEIRLEGVNAEVDNYHPGETLVSRTLISVRDLEILDHIKTSTWKKFLTDMRSDSQGNVRETDSNMARVELLSVRPSPSHPAEEARLRAKILPLRLYVDQDALDFFKKFFAFQDPNNPSVAEDGEKKNEIYFQHAEVFPVDIKLDYKPRRVDYRALRDGKTIELMNFFHFDGAEMTLRHLTLHGITGWPRFFDTLNDLWTPDVKATQLVDVISGVAPIRSVVNVGSGIADLVLLPIAQYKKDGRIVRGLQKGTKAFIQSTAMEAVKLSARLATGTQVILEQAESVLGDQFKDSITAEALQIPYENEDAEGSEEDLISRYAAQPAGLREGVQSAYRSLQRNLHSAAQTILAVPMEVYERSGNEGAVRAVVRAVPIAVLKPMIGASEAVSKTLMGLHNTLDPNFRLDNEAKYKHR